MDKINEEILTKFFKENKAYAILTREKGISIDTETKNDGVEFLYIAGNSHYFELKDETVIKAFVDVSKKLIFETNGENVLKSIRKTFKTEQLKCVYLFKAKIYSNLERSYEIFLKRSAW